MALHDWVPVPPLNDIEAAKQDGSLARRLIGTAINTLWVAFPPALTLAYFPGPHPVWVESSFIGLYATLSAVLVDSLFLWQFRRDEACF